MKKTFILIALLFIVIDITAQTLPLEHRKSSVAGVYYKDLNNFLDPFVGTYLYSDATTTLEIVLQKKIHSNVNNIFHEDILIGGYRYVKNGVQIINTINQLNTILSNGTHYYLSGNCIFTGNESFCRSCTASEKYIFGSIHDPAAQTFENLILRKTYVGNQFAIKVFFHFPFFESAIEENGHIPTPPRYPINQEFTLTKQ